MLGGKPSHPVSAIPGGWSRHITEEERQEILQLADDCIELGKMTVNIFKEVVLKNPEYAELLKGDTYKVVTNYLGTVDENEKVAYYDGTQKFVSYDGREIARFRGKEYLNYIAERTLPWSYLKAPYIKQFGWKGFVDGEGTSLYSVGPLARFNVAEGYSTPLAQKEYEEMVEYFGGKPIHNILAYHWARAIEILNQAERIKELAQDPDITNPETCAPLGEVSGEGVGIVEAPRGTLIHHYKTDSDGIVTDANLIVSTTQNKAPIQIAVKRAAQHFIKNGEVDEGILNFVEMAYRPYDLCLACATHAFPGHLPIQVEVYSKNGKLIKKLRNF